PFNFTLRVLYWRLAFHFMITHQLSGMLAVIHLDCIEFYLAAAVLLVLTVESCLRLLTRDSFGIAVVVYVTVFAWYFVDPFLNPEEYGYLPPFLLGQSYGQVLLFLIGFRVAVPAATRWILSRPSTGILAG